ncbi:hypothetical protein JCM11491_006053 [Sporobolomyces phaffii]
MPPHPRSVSSSLLSSVRPVRPAAAAATRLSRRRTAAAGLKTAAFLHPATRTRLTNWTFYLCAVVSVATVSLTMSGTLGNGRAIGCPARASGPNALVGVGAQEEEERERDARTKGKARAKVSNSRWLDEPEVEAKEVWRAGRDGRLERVSTASGPSFVAPAPARPATDARIDRRDGVLPTTAQEVDQAVRASRTGRTSPSATRSGTTGIAWRNWVGLSGKGLSAATASPPRDERVV